jgi:hypothetical protein
LSGLVHSVSSSRLVSAGIAAPVLMKQQSVLHNRGFAGAPQVLASSLPPEEQRVVNEYRARVASNPHVAIAVCAIQALTSVVRASTATTMMGLEKELQRAVHALKVRCSH